MPSGRSVVVRHSARRFLATLLREGGLPVHIGNLPDLVGALVREIGWDALAGIEGTAARRFAVAKIKASAQGMLRSLLDAPEAVEALEELLADGAEARSRLAQSGVDPTALGAAEDVRRMLDEHEIALPGARNERLLTAIPRLLPGAAAIAARASRVPPALGRGTPRLRATSTPHRAALEPRSHSSHAPGADP